MSEDGEMMERQLQQIGARIRRWREEGDLTLQSLAEQSGVATSTIQKVETAQMVPTVAVLMKIARGLGRRPSELISDEAPEMEVAYLREKDHYVLGSRRGMRVERLSGDVFEPEIEVWRVVLQAGYGSGSGAFGFDGEEVVVCEKGTVEFTIDEEVHSLEPGDSLHFKAALPHAWRNTGDVPAEFIVICNFPRQFRAALHRRLAAKRKR